MRIAIFLIFSVVLGCKSETDKINLNISDENLAKANFIINNYLNESLSENYKYSNKRVIKVDSIFIISNEDSINNVLNSIDSIESDFKELYNAMEDQEYIFKDGKNNFTKDTLILNEFDSTMRKKLNLVVELFNSETTKFTGWKIEYEYVLNSMNNNEKTIRCFFYINTDFSKVIRYSNRPLNLFDKKELSKLKNKIYENSLDIARFKQFKKID